MDIDKKNKSQTRDDSCDQETDYYFDDNGLMVMTASFHLKRGFCCGNKCRHCPYEVKPQTEK